MFYEQKGKIYCSKTMETIEDNRKTLTKNFFLYYRVAHTFIGKLDKFGTMKIIFQCFMSKRVKSIVLKQWKQYKTIGRLSPKKIFSLL